MQVYLRYHQCKWQYNGSIYCGKSHGHQTDVLNFCIVLRIITDAPWYVSNAVIKHDLQVPSVRQEMRTYSVIYHARLEGYPNDLAISLLQQPPHNRRLKRYYPVDLVTRF